MLGRQVPEQLAHGRAAREGGARPRARARALGRRLRPHARGRDVAARVRRPHPPAARAHRRPHRPRADPHAAGQVRAHQDVDVFMECTITHLLKDGERVAGAFGYWRATGELVALPRAGVRPRDRRHRAVLRGDVELVGVHRRRARARLRGGRRARRHGVRPVPPDRDGLAAGRRAACSSPRPCAARAASSRTRTASASWSATTRSGMELSTRDIVARAIYTEVAEGRGTPRGGVYLDVSHLPARHGAGEAAEHVRTSSTSSPASTSRASRWRSGRRATTSWAACGSRPRPRKSRVVGLFAAGECAGGLSRRDAARRQLALRPARLRPPRRAAAAEYVARRQRGRGRRDATSPPRPPSCDGLLARRRRGPVRAARRAAADDAAGRRDLPRRGRPDRGARPRSRS